MEFCHISRLQGGISHRSSYYLRQGGVFLFSFVKQKLFPKLLVISRFSHVHPAQTTTCASTNVPSGTPLGIPVPSASRRQQSTQCRKRLLRLSATQPAAVASNDSPLTHLRALVSRNCGNKERERRLCSRTAHGIRSAQTTARGNAREDPERLRPSGEIVRGDVCAECVQWRALQWRHTQRARTRRSGRKHEVRL